MCGSRSQIWRFSSLGLWDAGVQRRLLSVWRRAFQLQQHTREKKKCCKYILVFHTNKVFIIYYVCFYSSSKLCMNVIFESQRQFHVRTLTTHTLTIPGWSVINTGISAVSWAAEPVFFSCHNLEVVKKSTFMMDLKPSPLSYSAWAFVALLLNVPLSWKYPNRFTTDEYFISFFNNFHSTQPFCWHWPRISMEVWWLQLWKGCHGYLGLLR